MENTGNTAIEGSSTTKATTETSSASLFAPSEMLGEVNEAIRKVLKGGQSYRLGSRQLTRADLSLLREYQKELRSEMAQEEEGARGLIDDTYVAVFEGR